MAGLVPTRSALNAASAARRFPPSTPSISPGEKPARSSSTWTRSGVASSATPPDPSELSSSGTGVSIGVGALGEPVAGIDTMWGVDGALPGAGTALAVAVTMGAGFDAWVFPQATAPKPVTSAQEMTINRMTDKGASPVPVPVRPP